ncbi:hypothetical protein MTR67_038839 [Solanum verrucosum]|uniref:Uncharacterized protein n=1 Tax=Solanum verrucosum TaxID=315347 RepID=A0AAF0ZQL1_SOLVR|nr:hypothetical protein MTR67_038839 [Solanum verrucosum]
MVMTTGHGKAHRVALASWEMCQVKELLVKGPRAPPRDV